MHYWKYHIEHAFTDLSEALKLQDVDAIILCTPTQMHAAQSIECMKAENGAILTLSLSFNNDGPLGTFFRYICDNGTYMARYDDLVDGYEEVIDVSNVAVSMKGIPNLIKDNFAKNLFPEGCCRNSYTFFTFMRFWIVLSVS